MQVRVRILDGQEAVLTIKSAEAGLDRAEFEFAIPLADAEALFALCGGCCLAKRRHHVPVDSGLCWEVDVFEGRHRGLVLAEVELESADAPFARPDWLGAEVTGDARYYNATLAGEQGAW